MKINSFIVCDDIRTEIGNKHSLIGVYDEVINFFVTPDKKNTWPKAMKLGFFIKISFDKDEKGKISSFKFISDYNGSKKELGEGSIDSEKLIDLKKLKLAIVFNNFEFKEAGNIKFSFEFYKSNNDLYESITIDESIVIQETVVE
ncbi:MAG: hypothetical protein KAT05_01435 [Spirochaetes bacterium]|nr:hypothetical protein [Spirochaetota bacterium]